MKFKKLEVTTVFIVICTTSIPLGIIFGGVFVQKYYGGYEQRNSMNFVVIQITFSSFFTLPVYFFKQLWTISLMLWLLMFFGGSTIPILQGITISSLPDSLRASGNSFTNLLIFTLGFSAAPFFYGLIFDWTKNYDEKLAFILTLSWGFVALIMVIICAFIRYKKFDDPNSQENKNLSKAMENKEEIEEQEQSLDNIEPNSKETEILANKLEDN